VLHQGLKAPPERVACRLIALLGSSKYLGERDISFLVW
jgi:hypothetical protein